mgnify:CR=1 FL=1
MKQEVVTKRCVIVNCGTHWLLQVHGVEARLDGIKEANVFSKHYSDLGYKVILKTKKC